VLRKDFTVAEADVADARLMGADAVLLIVAALGADELRRFFDLATSSDSTPSSRSTTRASSTLPSHSARAWSGSTSVTWSPLRSTPSAPSASPQRSRGRDRGRRVGDRRRADAARLGAVGYDAVLVGEHLVRAGDPPTPCAHWMERRSPPAGEHKRERSLNGPEEGEIFIKICGITSEADALLAVGLGPMPSASSSPPPRGRSRSRRWPTS